MSELALYDAPDLMDLVATKPGKFEAEFYITEAQARGGDVLELGCGTGRLAIPLAQAGVKVTGLDVSPAVLSRAREKAKAADVPINFIEGDMRDFTLHDCQFGLIFVALNSLLHLHEADDISRCVDAARRHLAPGGALVFDIFNPSIKMLNRQPGERYSAGSGTHPVHGDFTVQETCDYDAAAQVSRQVWYWSAPGNPDFFTHPLNLRVIFPQETPLLVKNGGLRLAARYGDFTRSPFTRTSWQQLCVCEHPT